MKGIVFTKLLEMIEEEHGYELVDKILVEVKPESGGIYTAVGTYHHSEAVAIVSSYAKHANVEVSEALRIFGRYLFDVFYNSYSSFFEPNQTAFDFLESIDNYIHIEVAKLYPDAQLPKFTTERTSDDSLIMLYESDRRMSDLAHGLIEKTLEHFNEKRDIEVESLNNDGSKVKFIIKSV